MLLAVYKVQVIRSQRLRLYRQGIYPRLTRPLLINSFPIVFFEKEIQPSVTHFLKKCVEFAKQANPALLFLPTKKGGLGLPSVISIYKKQQASKMVQLFTSQDVSVRAIYSSGFTKGGLLPALEISTTICSYYCPKY